MNNKKRLLFVLIGPAIFLLCCFAIPGAAFPTLASRAAIGTVADGFLVGYGAGGLCSDCIFADCS